MLVKPSAHNTHHTIISVVAIFALAAIRVAAIIHGINGEMALITTGGILAIAGVNLIRSVVNGRKPGG